MEIINNKGFKILIDDEDFEKANFGKKLFVKDSGFVVIVSHAGNKTKHTFLHKVIMPAPKGMHVDHINGSRLDNRKCNLRVCTHAENQRNKTKQKGIISLVQKQKKKPRFYIMKWLKNTTVSLQI